MTKLFLNKRIFASFLLSAFFLHAGHAASLQVSPVLIDIETEKAAASTLTIKNTSDKPLNAQVRVFKWTQVNGKDSFEETDDVVASPPLTSIHPNGSHVVRVVRMSQSKVQGEESYRLVIDELPDENQKKGTIALLVRHAIPVFFASPQASPPTLTWSLLRTNGKLQLKAVNEGDKRLRLANMSGRAAGGSVDFGKGLVGYVLGHSRMNFFAKASTGSISGDVFLKADTNMEPVNATLSLK